MCYSCKPTWKEEEDTSDADRQRQDERDEERMNDHFEQNLRDIAER